VIEVDGVHTMHLGDIGHLLSEEKLADVGSIDIACVPLGGYLSPTRAAALIAQLDPHIVVPMPMCDDDADCAEALQKFFHEMGTEPVVQPKLSVTTSSLPAETTTVLLESARQNRPDAQARSRTTRPRFDHRPDEIGTPASTGSGAVPARRHTSRSAALAVSSDPLIVEPERAGRIIVTALRTRRASSRSSTLGRRHGQRQARPSATCRGG
jgi:hypothetical protein